MKKFIALLMVAVMTMAMATSVFAEEIALTSNEPGNKAESLETVMDLTQADATVTIVVKMTDEAHYGWGLGNFGANVNGTWTDSSIAAAGEIACADANEASFTYTMAEIVASFGVTDASAIANLMFGTWNGGQIVSVTYNAAAPAGDMMPVVSVAMVAMVACAAFVVLRKKEA